MADMASLVAMGYFFLFKLKMDVLENSVLLNAQNITYKGEKSIIYW